MRYTQDQNFLIRGPGLPDQGAVAVGPDELKEVWFTGYYAGSHEMMRWASEKAARRFLYWLMCKA